MSNQPVHGPAIFPKNVRNPFTLPISSFEPKHAPAITSECPPIYFVAEYKTKSAPCFNGCCQIGPMYVLSTDSTIGFSGVVK